MPKFSHFSIYTLILKLLCIVSIIMEIAEKGIREDIMIQEIIAFLGRLRRIFLHFSFYASDVFHIFNFLVN